MHVLVVEDECLIRMLVCNLLEDAGYACIEAANAIEALALLDSKLCRPALLVTDFNLGPGPNGQTLAREAVSRNSGAARRFHDRQPGVLRRLPVSRQRAAGCEALCRQHPGRARGGATAPRASSPVD